MLFIRILKMKLDFKSKGMRIAVGIAVPLLLLAVAIYLYVAKQGPPCLFYKLTGLHCAGCGSGRATVDLLHGKLWQAFCHNPIYVMLLPFIAYYMVKVYIAYVFGKDVLPFFEVNTPTAIVILVITVAFFILRNIPVYPFTLLAP